MAEFKEEKTNLDQLFNHFQDIFDSEDYRQLASAVNDSVNQAIDLSKQGIKRGEYQLKKSIKAFKTQYNNVFPGRTKSEKKIVLAPVAKTPAGTFSGPFLAVLSGCCLVLALIPGIQMLFSGVTVLSAIASGVFLTIGGITAFKSGGLMRRVTRFKQYLKAIDLSRPSIQTIELAQLTGKKQSYIQSDLSKMIQKRMFPEGHLSEDGNLLLLTDAAYRSYREDLQKEQLKKAEAQQLAEEEKAHPELKEVYAVIHQGQGMIEQIRHLAQGIQNPVIQSKTANIIDITEKILDDVKQYPDHLPDIRRFIQYYLPMTIKITDAYRELSGQPIQGEKIQETLSEIDGSFDSILEAYHHLYDQLFSARTLDISSDIAVMKTMLSRDGLSECSQIMNKE